MNNNLRNKDNSGTITPQNIMCFAKRILSICCIILIGSAIIKIFKPTPESDVVWNFVTYLIPSIIMLIIGYYFGKNSKS